MSFSKLCQLNNGCMGCCGHDFLSKEKIKKAIRMNTLEFAELSNHSQENLLKFRDRASKYNLRDSVCLNLIEKKGKLFCPLHPALNDGEDLREDHCDIDYFCKTVQEFIKWNEEKQVKFVKFIKNKKLDNITYSMLMDKGSLLKEFTKA